MGMGGQNSWPVARPGLALTLYRVPGCQTGRWLAGVREVDMGWVVRVGSLGRGEGVWKTEGAVLWQRLLGASSPLQQIRGETLTCLSQTGESFLLEFEFGQGGGGPAAAAEGSLPVASAPFCSWGRCRRRTDLIWG